MNKLNKILLTLSIVIAIAFCTILVLYLNLKSKKCRTKFHASERACGHFFRPLCLYSFYNLED